MATTRTRMVLGIALAAALTLGMPLLAARQKDEKDAFDQAGKSTEKAMDKAGDATGKALEKAGDATDEGLDATGKGVGAAVEHGGRGVTTGAKKAAGAVKKAGGAVADVFSDDNGRPRRQVIREVQEELKELGYYGGAIDGIAGPVTASALSEFQKDRGLTVTGKVNRTTLDKLDIDT